MLRGVDNNNYLFSVLYNTKYSIACNCGIVEQRSSQRVKMRFERIKRR